MKKLLLSSLTLSLSHLLTFSQPGKVVGQQKISNTQGNFTATLANTDHFGNNMTCIGDLDGDGTADLVAGADKTGGTGAVYVLFMNQNGTVKSYQKITNATGGFTGTIKAGDDFGYAVTNLGDLDGDGVTDIAVGCEEDPEGGTQRVGSVWILFMNTNGTVKGQQKISKTQGGFTGLIENDDRFSSSLCGLGDIDNDGKPDLAVGAVFDDDGGSGQFANRGAVWILYLNANGTVKSYKKISGTTTGFTTALKDGDFFGCAIASLGDLDNDGVKDIAAGAYLDDDGNTDVGAYYVIFMNASGGVKSYQKVSLLQGGMTGIASSDYFGYSIACIGDIDNDNIVDLAVGAPWDDDVNSASGTVWIIFQQANGKVKSTSKISNGNGGFSGTLLINNVFGNGVAYIGDLNKDKKTDIVVGSGFDDDGGTDRGAMWILNLDGDTSCTITAGLIASTTTVCVGGSASFSNSSSGATGYAWKENGNTFATTINATRTFSSAGSYVISLEASNGGCKATSQVTVTVIICTGMKDLADEVALNAYPNPSQGETTISYHLAQAASVSLEVTNVIGERVSELAGNELQSQGAHSYRIKIPNGISFVKLSIDGRVITQKVVSVE